MKKLLIGGVCSLLFSYTGVGFAADTLLISAEQRQTMGIEVIAAATDKGTTLAVTAKIILPPASVRVVAAPANGLVTSLLHQAGEQVKVGDKLASIASPDVVEAQRQYLQARLKHQLASDNASREQSLAAQGLIAKNTWLLTQNEVKLAQADQDAATATLRLLGVKPGSESSEITLTAPISGSILETLVEPGQRVEAPAALVKIGNLLQLGLEIPLTPQQAQSVQVGQSVTVEGTNISGTIRALQPALDMAQNVIVRADIAQETTTLYPGQSVKVSLQGAASPAAARSIPTSAVVWAGDKAYVFTENPTGFTATPITLLSQNDQQASISGLAPDSRIAIKGLASLKAKWQEAGE